MLDRNREYAIVLEGGGARGAYQVGVWRALEEGGIRYNAVAGSSVGALNGALMTMRQLDKAEELWKNIRFSQVMNVDDEVMKNLFRRNLSAINLKELAKKARELVRSGGFDVRPLRELLEEMVDERAIRESPIEFFIATFSISEFRELYLRARDIEPGAIGDMLLASAYYPAFRNEPLGGKRYIDGGVQDVLPITPLIERGYKEIIAIRVFGFGVERRVEIPDDVHVTTIAPTGRLGPVLNFDQELSNEQFTLGYFDGRRALEDLVGVRYYLRRTLNESQGYEHLIDLANRHALWAKRPQTLREQNERALPQLAKMLNCEGDYYDLYLRCMEHLAEKQSISPFEVMLDVDLEHLLQGCAPCTPQGE